MWRIVNGKYEILRLKTMRAIAAALNVPPAEIAEFAWKTEPMPEDPHIA